MTKKRPKPRSRAAPPSETAHERRQERLDARRRARAEALAARQRAERRRRLVRIGAMSFVSAGLVWFFLGRGAPPTPDEIDGHRVLKLGESGVGEHVSGTVEYDSTPPVHGSHNPQPAACGVHAEPIPNEQQVHSLEHGAVGIQYRPSLPTPDVRRIERLVRAFDSDVFSAPYPGLPTPVAVSSWGELMRLDSFDERAVEDYVKAFRGTGPERGASCPNTSDQPFRPAGNGAGG